MESMTYIRESKIEKYLVDQVKKRGGVPYKFVAPGRSGVPDRLCLMPGGEHFFVECKAPGKKPTPAQILEHRRLAALGHRIEVVDSIEGVDLIFLPRKN